MYDTIARTRMAHTSAKCLGAEDEGYSILKDKAININAGGYISEGFKTIA